MARRTAWACGMRLLAAGLWVALLGLAGPALAQPLPALRAMAEGSALGLQAADLDAEIALQRLEAARAQQGARAFIGSTLSQNREPVTDTATRRYSRVGATAGLRWPLLGGAEAAARAVDDAGFALAAEPLRRQQVLIDLRRELRVAYTTALRAGERLQLIERFAVLQAQAQSVLDERTRAGLLLAADRLAFESMFVTARLERERALAVQADALADLRVLTRQALPTLDPVEPDESTACLDEVRLLPAGAQRPPVALAQLVVESRQRQLERVRWSGVEASVTVQQSLARDIGGQGGYATQLGVDLAVPLDWTRWRDSQRSELRLRLRQAQLALQQRQDEDGMAVRRVLRGQALRDADLGNALQRVDVILEADRVARLRGAALDGDVFERALKVRYELLLAALAASEARQRRDGAQTEVLAWAAGAECSPQARGPALAPELLQTLGSPLPLPSVMLAPTPAWRPVAWFAWQGQAALTAAAGQTAVGGERLLVSFTGDEIARLAVDASAANTLRERLAQARARGWKIDLLLGDPGFVLLAGRAKLLRLLGSLSQFDFDGLNLDLERSQLPADQQAGWWPQALATLKAVRQQTPWPLTLTTHYREFERVAVGHELRAAGVSSAMPMVYVSDPARAADVVRRLLAFQPGLRLTVVQSAESELTPAESSYAAGRATGLKRWQALAERLAGHANFGGVAVQSWESFAEMSP